MRPSGRKDAPLFGRIGAQRTQETDPEVDLGPTSQRRTTHHSESELSPERTLANVASGLSMNR